jgi:membrane protein YqaA with SNARE-associated domain
MLKRLYQWMIKAAQSPRAVWILFGLSFAESSFFPLPPDLMLVPMCVAKPGRSFYYAAICTLGSVLGGIAGYCIGDFLFAQVGEPIINAYGYQEAFHKLASAYNEHGFWWVFASGLTPLPYKIFTIASGVSHLSLPVFIAGSVCSRGLRFFVEGGLIWKFGAPIHGSIEKRLELILCFMMACLLGGFLLLKYVF